MTVSVISTRRFSGGSASLIESFRWAARVHPDALCVDGPSHLKPLITSNLLAPSYLLRGGFVYLPQNAWAWCGRSGTPALAARRNILRVVSELAYRRMDRLVRLSEGIPCRNRVPSLVLPNPLDPGFEPAWRDRVAPRDAGDYLVTIGQFIAYKNLDTLLRGYRLYREAGGGLRLLIRGPLLDRSIVQRLEALAADLGSDVHLDPRPASRPEVLGILAGARVAVFPSEVEASPVTLLEALAAGVPVAASDIPGHVTTAASVSGDIDLFPPGSAQDCADALRRAERSSAAAPAAIQDSHAREAHRASWAQRLVSFLQD